MKKYKWEMQDAIKELHMCAIQVQEANPQVTISIITHYVLPTPSPPYLHSLSSCLYT